MAAARAVALYSQTKSGGINTTRAFLAQGTHSFRRVVQLRLSVWSCEGVSRADLFGFSLLCVPARCRSIYRLLYKFQRNYTTTVKRTSRVPRILERLQKIVCYMSCPRCEALSLWSVFPSPFIDSRRNIRHTPQSRLSRVQNSTTPKTHHCVSSTTIATN